MRIVSDCHRSHHSRPGLDRLAAVAMIVIGGHLIAAAATVESTNFAVTATVVEQCAVVLRAQSAASAPRCSSGAGAALASTATVTMTPDAASGRTLLTYTF